VGVSRDSLRVLCIYLPILSEGVSKGKGQGTYDKGDGLKEVPVSGRASIPTFWYATS